MRFYPVKSGISTSWRKENLRQETWHIVLKWTYLVASWWRFDEQKKRLPPASRGITIYETAGQVSGYKIGWFAMYI
jgi:hypothetical protein